MALVEKIVLYSIMMVIMFGIGCTVKKSDAYAVLNYKRAFLVGITSQFGFMPFMGWALSRILKLNTAQALGTIVICAAPGGSYSNFFCYYTDGNLGLSIAMTTFSTFSSFGMTPLMIWLWADYVDGFEDEEEFGKLDMDYLGITLTLLTIVTPVGLGAWTRTTNWGRAERYGWCCRKTKRPRWIWFNVMSGVFGVIFLVLALLIGIDRYGESLFIDSRIIIASALITPTGAIFGFVVAKLCGLQYREALTVCWETGLQNITMAIGLIDLSFEDGGQPDKVVVLEVPLHIVIFYNIEVAIMCLLFKFINKRIAAKVTAKVEK